MNEPKFNLSQAKHLHNREYQFEEYHDGVWVKKGFAVIFPEEMFINDVYINSPVYSQHENSIKYTFGAGKANKAGGLYFDKYGMSFLGSYSNPDGTVTMVRGNQLETVYSTQITENNEISDWKDFTVGTYWDTDGNLKAYYKLGEEDVTDGTGVTKVNHVTWETTIERESGGMSVYDFTFSIVIDFTGTSFSGTCDYQDRSLAWNGKARKNNKEMQKKRELLCSRSARFLLADANSEVSSELSLQELLNISQYQVEEHDGHEVIVDMAQQQTSIYFEDILVNSLPEENIKDFFGTKRTIDKNVQETMDKYKDFYKDKAVMNMGYLLYQTFKDNGTAEDMKAAKKIDIDKINKDWDDTSKSQTFAEQANALYCNAYTNVVASLKPYLKDGKGWAKKLYNFVISDSYMNIWRVQIASLQFSNVKKQIFEFYTKLTVLDNSDEGCEQARNAVSILFSSIMNILVQKMSWVDEYREQFVKYLKDAIINLREGNLADLQQEIAKEVGQQLREQLENAISCYDSLDQFLEDVTELFVFTFQRPDAAGKPMVEAVDLLTEEAEKDERFVNLIKGFGKAWGKEAAKLFRVLCFAAGMGLCISLFVLDKKGDAESIVKDIGLSLCGITFFVKGMANFLETALGKWILEKVGSKGENLAKFCENFGKWFSAEGEISGVAAKIFGKNVEFFMKTRLGPACAIATVVLSGFFLSNAVHEGNVFNIVMESLNLSFAAVDLGMLGLSMMSISWAGPVGLVVGIIGAIVIAVQFFYNLIKPKHQKDKVELFIEGPLKDAGYVVA